MHIYKNGDLSEDDIQLCENVRIIIIDEMSFVKDKELLLLDRRLKEMRDRNKYFEEFSIIFAVDFRQLESNAATE